MSKVSPGRIPHDKPCALVEHGPHGLRITAVNHRAATDGTTPGMRLADARAAIPGLLTHPAEPARDRAKLRALAHAAGRYGPGRNIEGATGHQKGASPASPAPDNLSDGLWIDITGVAHLFGGEVDLAEDLLRRLHNAGFTAAIGIADTPGAAYILARFKPAHRNPASTHASAAPITIAPRDAAKNTLADYPVEGLRLTEPTLLLLRRLGLRRIGQLYELPRDAMARRFRDFKPQQGARTRLTQNRALNLSQAVTMRLDQVLGDLGDPRVPLIEPPSSSIQRAYPEGLISHEGITAAVRELTTELCRKLGARHQGARRLRLSLYRVDGTATNIAVGTSRPSREPGHIIRLFEENLDQVDAGFGIDMITVAALHTDKLDAHQSSMTAAAADAHFEAAARLIDRLKNRLGPASVFTLANRASHIPERAQRRMPPGGTQPASTSENKNTQQCTGHPAQPHRPPFLLASPEPIEVIADIPDGPPARFRWRRLSRRILKASGPERIAPEWWRNIATTDRQHNHNLRHENRVRDYYAIEDDRGGRYWIYRAGLYSGISISFHDDEDDDRPPAWFLHGLFG